MSIHSTLTGTDLHESKGAAAAATNTVAVADGLGSATWKALPVAAIDPTGFKNLNKTVLYVPLFNGSASAFTFYAIYVPFACTITSATLLIGTAGTATGTTTILTQNIGLGTFSTWSFAGATSSGQTITNVVSSNNNVVAGGLIFLSYSYAPGTGSVFSTNMTIALSCTLT